MILGNCSFASLPPPPMGYQAIKRKCQNWSAAAYVTYNRWHRGHAKPSYLARMGVAQIGASNATQKDRRHFRSWCPQQDPTLKARDISRYAGLPLNLNSILFDQVEDINATPKQGGASILCPQPESYLDEVATRPVDSCSGHQSNRPSRCEGLG